MKVRLGDYIEQVRGVSYSPSDLHSTLNENSVTLLRANNINDNKINFDDVVFVDKSKVNKNQYLQEGDILVCASSGSKQLVGKAAYVDKYQAVTFGAFCKIVRPKSNIKRYLGYFFESPYYRTRISELSGGANINNIKNEHIDNLEFELPELSIQNNICIELDKISLLIDKRKHQLEKLDLVIKAKFKEMFENLSDRCPLSKVSILITKGASPKWQGVEYQNEGTLFITSENVREGFVDLSKKKYLDNKINKIQPRSKLHKNDVLINIVGASIGRAAIYEYDFVANINQAVALVRVNTKLINLQYLITFLNSNEALESYNAMKKGGARDNLSLKNISDLLIPIASIKQQNEFAAFIEQTDNLKFTIKQSLEKLETLKKVLMQKYFG